MTVRVDTRLLAKYGIFQQTDRVGPLAMTVMCDNLCELTTEDRADLMEFAQFTLFQHELDEPEPVRDPMAAAYAMACRDDLGDFGDDEGTLFDEA